MVIPSGVRGLRTRRETRSRRGAACSEHCGFSAGRRRTQPRRNPVVGIGRWRPPANSRSSRTRHWFDSSTPSLANSTPRRKRIECTCRRGWCSSRSAQLVAHSEEAARRFRLACPEESERWREPHPRRRRQGSRRSIDAWAHGTRKSGNAQRRISEMGPVS